MKDPGNSSLPSAPTQIAPLLRLRKVLELTGLGRSTLYRMMSERTFPLPVRLGRRAVAWKSPAVEEWTLSRPPVSEPPRITGPKR
jgi:prophage regulatory protein